MRKALFVLLLVLLPSVVFGQFKDTDGQLILSWQWTQSTGDPLSYFVVDYSINGSDSIIHIETANFEDSSVVLLNIGDWCIASLYAVSTIGTTSYLVYSDTAYYASPTGINPPTGVMWKQ